MPNGMLPPSPPLRHRHHHHLTTRRVFPGSNFCSNGMDLVVPCRKRKRRPQSVRVNGPIASGTYSSTTFKWKSIDDPREVQFYLKIINFFVKCPPNWRQRERDNSTPECRGISRGSRHGHGQRFLVESFFLVGRYQPPTLNSFDTLNSHTCCKFIYNSFSGRGSP